MSTRSKNQVPLNKASRAPKTLPSRRRPGIDPATAAGGVVLIETLQGHEHVIRISIETADAARQPERIIMF